jgi:hypothetical protein
VVDVEKDTNVEPNVIDQSSRFKKSEMSTFGLIAECNVATDAKNDGENGGHCHRAVRDLVEPGG